MTERKMKQWKEKIIMRVVMIGKMIKSRKQKEDKD